MSLHSGYVESCHEPKHDIEWYLNHKDFNGNLRFYQDFCDALESGGFIPCGSSGCLTWNFDEKGNLCCGDKCPKGSATCCFVFGKSCDKMILKRRWTCCGKMGVCTLDDMRQKNCSR